MMAGDSIKAKAATMKPSTPGEPDGQQEVQGEKLGQRRGNLQVGPQQHGQHPQEKKENGRGQDVL